MKRTVWNTGGCTSWYLDASGRNTTIWPGTTTRVPAARPGGWISRSTTSLRRRPCGRKPEGRRWSRVSRLLHVDSGPYAPPVARARTDRRVRRRRPPARRGARPRGRPGRRPRPRLDLLDRLLGGADPGAGRRPPGHRLRPARPRTQPARAPRAAPTRSPTTWRPCSRRPSRRARRR